MKSQYPLQSSQTPILDPVLFYLVKFIPNHREMIVNLLDFCHLKFCYPFEKTSLWNISSANPVHAHTHYNFEIRLNVILMYELE
jgi:hypothetical protein